MRKVCNFFIKTAIYGLVFLIPLFWLPWTVEAFEFNKQYLLFFLVVLAFLAWLTKMIIVQKRLTFYRTPLDLWILIFMTVVILSSIFSVDKISSWLGFYGRFTDSTIALLTLGMFYFLVVNNLKTAWPASFPAQNPGKEPSFPEGSFSANPGGLIPRQDEQASAITEFELAKTKKGTLSWNKIIRIFLTSVWLVVIVSYLSLFGLWAKIPGLPQIMSFQSFNPLNGSFQGLSIFLVAVVSLLIGIILQQVKNRRERKIFLFVNYFLIGLAALLLVWINFQAAWLTLAAVMLVLLIAAIWTHLFRERINLLILPIVLLLISLAGLTGLIDRAKDFTGSDFIKTSLPEEVILDYQTAGRITWQTFKESPVLGSGPGTFLVDFAKFKPVQFNESRFWNIRFDKGPSYLMEMVGTTGLLGILSYLTIVVIFGLIIFIFLRRTIKGGNLLAEQAVTILSLFSFWLALLIGQFVYLNNTVLSFCFWLSMALTIGLWQAVQGKSRKIGFSFKRLPELGLVANVFLLIMIFVLLGLFYLGGRLYWADVKFSQAAADNEQLVRNLEETVNLNKYRENYRCSLSQAYLLSARDEAGKAEEERNTQLLQAYASGAIQQAREAVLLSPDAVMAWQNLAVIYRDSRGLVGGTLPFASDAFNQALALEPTNPFFYRELCRINLVSEEEEKNWDKTISYCQKAIDLKSDYLDAHIQLALVYEEKGDLEEAAERLKGALDKLRGVSFQRGSELAGAAAEIYFQLGRVYFNLEQLESAINMFEQSVVVVPNYANARYALALSYYQEERLEDALTQFQIVDQLVPGNQDVQTRIQQLQDQLQSTVPTEPLPTEGE